MLRTIVLTSCAAILLSAAAARADVITTYQLNSQDLACTPPAGCAATTTPTGPYGTVTVDQTSAASADVTVTLASGYTFNNAGDALEFSVGTANYPTGNLPHNGSYPITITNATTGFELDPPPPATSVFGPFNVGVTCHYTAGACDTSSPTADTLSFTVSSSDGELNFLETPEDAFFAADVTTGVDYCAGTNCNKVATYQGDVAATPEPSSLLLLGTGLLGFAGTLRRRLNA